MKCSQFFHSYLSGMPYGLMEGRCLNNFQGSCYGMINSTFQEWGSSICTNRRKVLSGVRSCADGGGQV